MTKITFPEITDEQISLLERLSNACGILSNTGEIRNIIQEEIKSCCDEIKIDALGNIMATRRSRQPHALKVMVAAHMDEVGFMVVDSDDSGLFRFTTVGGIDPRYLPGKPVIVGKEHLPGVIGSKPIHLVKREERKSSVDLDSLRLDVGPDGGGTVKPGDPFYFATRFTTNSSSLMGKALDNRIGVASLIYLLQNAPDTIDLQAAFTTQEEIGLRGARVSAYAFNPDLALVLDCTPAHDYPHWNDEENRFYNTHLDAGPAIYIADGGTLSDPRLLEHLYQTAEKYHIPYQIRQPGPGGTDAGAIHRQRTGIPSVSVSVPGRHAHSPVMIARKEDWANTFKLVFLAIQNLPVDILKRA